MNLPSVEIAVSSVEEHPSRPKVEWLYKEVQSLLLCKEISAQLYSDFLCRLARVMDEC